VTTPELLQADALTSAPIQQPIMCATAAELARACDNIAAQFEPLRDAIQHSDVLQLNLYALIAAGADLVTIGLAGKEVQAAIAVVAQQSRSEEDYLMLADRYKALVQNVTDTCKDLLAAAQYDAVITLGTKLKELQAAKASAEEQVKAAHTTAPILLCAAVAAHVPVPRNTIRTRDELQSELTSVREMGNTSKDVERVGIVLKAAKAAVAQQPLLEADYLTLSDRRAVMVQKVTDQCERLTDAEDYDALEALESELAELSACNVQRDANSVVAASDAVVSEASITADPETLAVKFTLTLLPADPALPAALSLPTNAPSPADDSPDWVDVADNLSTVTSDSEGIAVATADDQDREVALTALPFSEK
jgi:hypothetical protein